MFFATVVFKKAGDLPGSNFNFTGVSMGQLPPATVKICFKYMPNPAVSSSSSRTSMEGEGGRTATRETITVHCAL